jgi:hypothetical protein
VGIATAWVRGRAKVRLVFMDHDNLHLPMLSDAHLDPGRLSTGTLDDLTYAIGDPAILDRPPSLVESLRLIYRVGSDAAAIGEQALRRSLAGAYRYARRAIRRDPAVSALLPPEFPSGADPWDRRVVAGLSRALVVRDGEDWRERFREALTGDGP